jgi:hypothetical protein
MELTWVYLQIEVSVRLRSETQFFLAEGEGLSGAQADD